MNASDTTEPRPEASNARTPGRMTIIFLVTTAFLNTMGAGILEPSLGGLISRAAGPRQQGLVQGGNQSIESLARILGPVCGGVLYVQVGHASPYWSGAVIVGLAILVTGLAIPALQADRFKPNTAQSR